MTYDAHTAIHPKQAELAFENCSWRIALLMNCDTSSPYSLYDCGRFSFAPCSSFRYVDRKPVSGEVIINDY